MPKTISEHFNLKKTQAELDFANVWVYKDLPLFIDPLPLSQRNDKLSKDCHLTLKTYFQHLVVSIRKNNEREALDLLRHLREPNETRLGFSANRPQGAGIGSLQAKQIFAALKRSTAVKTGFITSLEECELMIPGIGIDKISDLTTNVIRGHLVQYTQGQCLLHNIPTQDVPLSPCFNPSSLQWESAYRRLPVVNGKALLFVPKVFVKISCAIEHYKYYRGYVLEYMQEKALAGGTYSNLVLTLKNEHRVIYKKELEKKEPCAKEFLYDFSKKHQHILEKYRDDLNKEARVDKLSDLDTYNEREIGELLAKALKSIPAGSEDATEYHNLMVGIVEFLFFPFLDNPVKEKEINEGRKRIDIVMDNAARSGIFWKLWNPMHVPCGKVPIECKNYRTDVGNPELDQLAMRLSWNTGMFGILCCRHFEDRGLFIKRCKDAWRQQKQLLVPLDDKTILLWLDVIAKGSRGILDKRLQVLIEEVWGL